MLYKYVTEVKSLPDALGKDRIGSGSKMAYIACNGCQEGRLASAFVLEFLRKNGWTITQDPAKANIVIFYACGICRPDEISSMETISTLKSEMSYGARLIVWGCLTKINPQILRLVYDGPLVGPKDFNFFEEFAMEKKVEFDDISANYLVPIGRQQANPLYKFIQKVETRLFSPQRPNMFYIRIGFGCTHNCTYCGDRQARGKITSRPMTQIISEFKHGLQLGYDKFFLVESDLGSQGIDLGYSVIDLLKELVSIQSKKSFKIILENVNPSFLKERFTDIEDILSSGKIELIGSPVQSGSNNILKLMGRQYKIEDWRECMLRIHEAFPNIHLFTHFLVGFPTETDEDFMASYYLLDQVFLDYSRVFKFSARPGIPATNLKDQVPEEIKASRYRRMRLHILLHATINNAHRHLIT